MTFLLSDSWETVTTHPQYADRGWTVFSSPSVHATHHDGTQCASCQAGEHLRRSITSSDTCYVAFWFQKTHEDQRIFFRFEGATTGQLYLEAQTDNTYQIKDQAGTVLGTSAAHASDVWHHVEFKGRFNTSIALGDVVLNVEGREEIVVAAGTNTDIDGDGSIVAIEIESGDAGRHFHDSFFLWNDLDTGDGWKDFMGMLRIEVLAPVGNGPDNDFIGSDANSVDNFLLIDDPVSDWHDIDVTYSEGSEPLDQDSYNWPAMTEAPADATIVGVQTYLVAKKTAANPKSLTPFYVDGGAEQLGVSTGDLTNGTYTFHTQFWNENPDASAPWTEAKIDTGNFGLRVGS